MTPEKKSGIISLIIGIIGFTYIIFYSNNVLLIYLGTALFTPFMVYGIGMMLNPKTKRREEGLIPFRGW
ncbi:hypothetical protein KKP91_01910 [Methanothermococcus sp. SCGC AD-155-M21]|nr:hypothetical protein [Methanothermococcus sp. SCGC AD-155-M21]